MKDGREVSRATCRVNEPVSFGGLTFYQSSYGSQSTGPIRLKVQLGDLDQIHRGALCASRWSLPGGQGKIIPMKVDGNLQGYGPAVLLAFSSGSGHPEVFWILKDHPELGEQPGPYRFTARVRSLRVLFRLPGEARPRGGVGLCRLSPVSARTLPGLLPAGGALGPGADQNPQREMAGAPAGSQPPLPGGIRRPPGTAPHGVEARDSVMISQILGSVMLIYLLVAILFLMAELWSSPRLAGCRPDHTVAGTGDCIPGRSSGAGSNPTGSPWAIPPPRRWPANCSSSSFRRRLSNFYESLIFFAWCLPALGLLAFRRYLKGYLGALVALLASLLLAYASFRGRQPDPDR